ncbi:hypothetical protein [Tenacibaculum bernardetii]|uniref:hypothetical protein n=1 Tax=Tenacibaculum bernardetii TaxID=3021375 RepID=UPI0023B0A12B|nr:hypothetical protein [Tenacibaculum bernardetii]
MSNNSNDYLKDAFAAPLGDFIASIGEGVGEAQAALDKGSLRQTLEIYNTNPDNSEASLKLLREIGYQPTFYTIPKTTAKAKISLSLSQQSSSILNGGQAFRTKMYATPVNATNTNKYNMNLNASAEIQFDIVPVPPTDTQIIRFLPNLIEKTITDNEGKTTNEKRTFGEIKTLLSEYNLNYAFGENTKESELKNESTFSEQKPTYIPGSTQVIHAEDVIVLSI